MILDDQLTSTTFVIGSPVVMAILIISSCQFGIHTATIHWAGNNFGEGNNLRKFVLFYF